MLHDFGLFHQAYSQQLITEGLGFTFHVHVPTEEPQPIEIDTV